MVEALLERNADVFAQDCEKQLPIHRAVLLGHDDVVEALVKAMESAECSLRYELSGS